MERTSLKECSVLVLLVERNLYRSQCDSVASIVSVAGDTDYHYTFHIIL